MTEDFDAQTLVLIEEHVRRLLAVMGFIEIRVHCRRLSLPPATLATSSPEEADDELLKNAALSSEPAKVTTRPHAAEAQLQLSIEAGETGKLLIGTHGTHLEALQHIIRSILRRQLGSPLYVIVDVNGYRARRERTLTQLAEAAARRARQTGRTVTLEPMGAADRRVLHTALATHPEVSTESTGQEPNRRVVVRPRFS
ncbi:MAG: R3H domain-containing nucleic acid-binding protein [Candidatus Andersenbacteria bacterium]